VIKKPNKRLEEEQMKKFFVVALAMLFVAGVVAEVAAEDKLKLSGTYRARAWYKDNLENYDDGDDSDEEQYFDQRLRIQGRITAAEGITANFRFDFSEVTWGLNTSTSRGAQGGWNRGTRDDYRSNVHVDRAFGRWDREMYTLSVGQAFAGVSLNGGLYSSNQFGVIFRLKTPVVVDFIYNKLDENGSRTDNDIGGVSTEDTDLFAGQATYKRDNWSVGVAAATFVDNSPTDDSPWGASIFGTATFGPLALQGQADFFGGDLGNRDYKGTQLWLNGQYSVMPNLYVGAHVWWADSHDESAGDRQITGLSDGGDPVRFADLGPFEGDILPFEDLAAYCGGAVQTTPEFDPSGQSSGAIGGTIYAGWRFMEPLLLAGQYVYVAPSSTSRTVLNKAQVIGLQLSYDFLPKTTLAGAWNWSLPDVDNLSSDAANVLVARIQMKF
jgi:hypothetical protein